MRIDHSAATGNERKVLLSIGQLADPGISRAQVCGLIVVVVNWTIGHDRDVQTENELDKHMKDSILYQLITNTGGKLHVNSHEQVESHCSE
jgi:hypothetical protein